MTRSAITRCTPIRWRMGMALAGAAWLAGCASTPDNAAEVIARANAATGAAQVKSLRYVAEGTGYSFGQAHKPGAAWPKITLHSVTRTVDYEVGAMRDEIVLSRAEPLGGGGYPLAGQQRNDQYVSGAVAWNVAGGNVAPGPRAVVDRVHQLWITPHGVLKAAVRNNASARRNGDGSSTVSFADAGRYSAVATVGADGLVTQVDSVVPDPVMGDTKTVTTYSEYRDIGGAKFPMRIRQSMGGYPVLDLAVKEVQLNAPVAALQVPEPARNTGERVAVEKVAEGVWFLGGGSHNSVAIETRDHMVLVETPLNDARSQAVIDQTKTLAPGKPIRFVVNSHAHFDHSGGVRAAVAEGATIVTQAANVPYFEGVMAQGNRVQPDRMAQSGKRINLMAVNDKLAMGDASRPIELHRITESVHSDSFLMVYLPNEKLLIEADAYTPLAPGAAPPTVPNANNLNLIANIERLKLNVDRILPLHGRVVALSELYTTAGKTAPAR